MERVVNPGPIDRTLLLSQHEHKSELLWKGEIPFSNLMRTVRMNDAWNLFRLHRPHERVEEILRRSGLYDVVCVGRMQYDRALVTAMVERWRPETHCFHLPFGEVTITLQDVQVLFGLRINGDAVYIQDATRRIRPWRTLLETLTGCTIAPTDMDGATRVRIHSITGYLRDQLQVDPIRDATPVERVERIARLYMLVILGGILFPNTSGNLISLQYLAFLDPIHDVGKYSWGSAVLAYLYRALCRASIGNVVDICGFIPLLQVWCWERILPVQPSAPPQHDGDMLLPYARRWTRGIDRDTESHHVLIPIRDQLDRMTEDQFRWTPYNEILHTLPHCCMVDEPLWMACVPMFCLEIVEVHSPDRVMRQFGHSQHVPVIPSWGTNHHVHDHRRRLGPEVLEMMDKYFRDWGNRHQSLAVEVNDGTSGAGYRLWYMRHGRLLIGRPTLEVDVSSGFVHSAGTSIAMSRGLFKLYSLALQWQRDTTSASHGEEVSQIVKDTLLEAGIQFREPFFEGDPLFEHVRARGPRRGRMGHRGRARGRARGRGAGGIPIPPDIEADVSVEAADLHVHQFGTSDIMNLLHMSFDPYSRSTRDVEGIGHMSYESTIDVGDYIPDIAGTSGTVRCDTEDTTIYNTQDFIEGLFDDPIESQIHTTGPSSTVEESPTTIIEDIVSTVNEGPDVTQIHTTGPSSTVEESPTTIIEDVVPTVNEDPDVTQIHTTGPSSTVEESPTTIIEDVVPTVNEDPDVTQTTLSPLSSPDVTFIMPVDDMPQTPGRKKLVKRIVKNVNIKDLPAKKRKRNNEDEDGYTGLRPRDVLRISKKGCGT